MERKLRIVIDGVGEAIGILDERNPRTADEIWRNLPIEGRTELWYEEVYFDCGLELDYENPSPTSEEGDISYWPPGRAICIFFGKSQPYSPVNHIGKIVSGLEIFRKVKGGERIRIERAEEDR